MAGSRGRCRIPLRNEVRMGKIAMKEAGRAAVQSVLRQLMPDIDKRLDMIESYVRNVDARLLALEQKVDARFDQQLAAINETSNKILKLEARVEGFMEAWGLLVQPVK